MSERFARYFFTLVIGNHVLGLFLTLSMYKGSKMAFVPLLFLVLVVSHSTSLVCLFSIDIVHFVMQKFSTNKQPPSIIFCMAITAVTLLPGLWVGFMLSAWVASLLNLNWMTRFADVATPGILFGVLVTILSMLFVQWLKSIKARYDQQAALMAAERRVLQARFDLLAKELHPHLLFNVIQNVLNLMPKETAAKTMLEDLAVYYQDILLVIDKSSIPLSEELALCRHYMALQKSRYQALSLVYNDETQGRSDTLLIPPLLLQPLLENAVKYALASNANDKVIHIMIRDMGPNIAITIVNPSSQSGNVARGFSKGLNNSEQRLKEYFGDRAHLSIAHAIDTTTVTIEMPHVH